MQNFKPFLDLCNIRWQKKAQQASLFLLTSWMAAPAFAGSDTTFSTMVDWVNDKLTGSMGALIAIIALVIAIISSMMGKFSAFFTVLVVVVGATLGGAIVIGFFTATF